MPLDDGGRLDQNHRLQTARPQSVKPNPEQAVEREQPGPTRPPATKNAQLMAEERGSLVPESPDFGIGGQELRRWNARA